MYENDLVLYRQSQRYEKTWRIPILAFSAILMVMFSYALYQQLVLGQTWTKESVSDEESLVLDIFIIAVNLALFCLYSIGRLEITVYPGRVEYRFFPFEIKTRVLPMEMVEGWERIELRSISQYDKPWSRRPGEEYNIAKSGGAVRLHLKDGRGIVFSISDPSAFLQALESASRSI